MSISLNDLKIGSIYRWVPTDYRSWVPFFDIAGLIPDDRFRASPGMLPSADACMLYLGRQYTGSHHDAYVFLVGEQKLGVYDDNFRYGLRAA